MKKIVFAVALAFYGIALASPVKEMLSAYNSGLIIDEGRIVFVEYIESTGTQYLNLGFKRTDYEGLSLEVKFSECKFVSSYKYFAGLIGWCEDTNGYSTGLKVASNGILLMDGRNNNGESVIESSLPVDIFAFLSESGAIVNGVEISDYKISTSYSARKFPFGLFCFSSSENGTPKASGDRFGCGKGRCHYLKVFSYSEIKHFFQPVRYINENEEWEGAMYDLVSGELFLNQGTGDFIIGPDL